MSRIDAFRRLIMALVWMPVYLVILAPLIFVIVVTLSVVRFIYAVVTGARFELRPRWAIDTWDWAEDNTLALMGDRGRTFRWTPPMPPFR